MGSFEKVVDVQKRVEKGEFVFGEIKDD